ncbi:MAG TPA: DUF3800 domain-containing protein [Bryobacteraceae bacterium]
MITFRAYLDDSGSDWKSPPRQHESPHYVLGGYLSTIDKWEVFTNEWQVSIDGPPRIEYFKASEAQSLKDQFEGWSPQERDDLILKLGNLINTFSLLRVDVALQQSAYDRLIKGKILQRWDDPYFICLLAAVEIVANGTDRLALPGTTAIDFVFDKQQKLERQAKAVFDFFKGTRIPFSGVIGKISHEDEKDFLPLQAADLEAWITRRELSRDGDDEISRQCFEVIRSIDPVRYVITDNDLEHFVRRFWENMHIMKGYDLAKRPKLHPFFEKMIVR